MQAAAKTAKAALYMSPRVTVDCFGGILVENCRRLTAYSPDGMAFDLGDFALRIQGENLRIQYLSRTGILVQGKVLSVAFSYP